MMATDLAFMILLPFSRVSITPVLIIFFFLTCGEKSRNGEVAPGDDEAMPETALVLSNSLKMRMGPNTMAAEIGRLASNTEVQLLRRSVDKDKIGNSEAYWYHVKTEEGLKGWVYGAYLSVNPSAASNQKKTREKLQEKLSIMMLGRWYAIKKSGSLKTLFMTFFKDKTFEMGFRKNLRSKGDYELAFEGKKVFIKLPETKKPLVTDIYGELRGVTFTLRGTYRGSEYNFRLTEKAPRSFDPRKRDSD